MSTQTIAGLSSGTIIGFGGAVSPVGDIPSVFFLGLNGVKTPAVCLEWIKTPTDVLFTIFHPCYPITDPSSLGWLSNGLVFIALLLIVWGAFELWGKIR